MIVLIALDSTNAGILFFLASGLNLFHHLFDIRLMAAIKPTDIQRTVGRNMPSFRFLPGLLVSSASGYPASGYF